MLSHTQARSRRSVADFINVPSDFYALFLRPVMSYTCAYYAQEDISLEEAQRAKFDHIGRKLRLKPYQSLFDIGCGWGSFVIHACKHFGVTAHGVTLSQEQAEYAQERIRREGLEGQALVECRDFRELVGETQYDRISAIGLIEHVGPRHLAEHFSNIYKLLNDDGLFLSHGITRSRDWRPEPGSDWVHDHLFPEGDPPSLSSLVTQLEDGSFEVQDVENLRAHYAKTCADWVARLRENREEVLEQITERAYRTRLLLLGLSSLYFEEGKLFLYQVLANKRMGRPAPLPLTREDLYG